MRSLPVHPVARQGFPGSMQVEQEQQLFPSNGYRAPRLTRVYESKSRCKSAIAGVLRR